MKKKTRIIKAGQRYAFPQRSKHLGAEFWIDVESMVNHGIEGESIPELERFIFLRVPYGWDKGRAKEAVGIAFDEIGGIRLPDNLLEEKLITHNARKAVHGKSRKQAEILLEKYAREFDGLPSITHNELFNKSKNDNISTRKSGVKIRRNRSKVSPDLYERLVGFKRRGTAWKVVMPQIQDDLYESNKDSRYPTQSTVERMYRVIPK